MSLKDKTAAIEQALNVLGKEAKEWWTYRNAARLKRIVDPETGIWASQFTANGNKYYIRSVEDGLGFKRYTQLKKMLSVVGFNATYSEQLGVLARMTEAANSLVTKAPRLNELFHEIANMQKAIELSEREWDFSMYAATLFIVRNGEDLSTWDEALANEKISDWHAEGLYEMDFFFLVMYWGSRLNEWWNLLPAKATKEARKVAPGVG